MTNTPLLSASADAIPSYDLSSQADQKKIFCAQTLFLNYLKPCFEKKYSDGSYSGQITLNISKKRGRNDPDIDVDGNVTSISFDIQNRMATEPTKFTLKRTYHPETDTVDYEIKSDTKNRHLFSREDLKQEWRYGYALMAASHAGFKNEAAKSTDKDKRSELIEKKDFITLTIPDPYEYVGKHTIKINGQDFTIPHQVTEKQAIGIAAFLEHFKVVQFTLPNGNVVSIEAPLNHQKALKHSEPVSPPTSPTPRYPI